MRIVIYTTSGRYAIDERDGDRQHKGKFGELPKGGYS